MSAIPTTREVWLLKQERADAASACYDGRGVAVPSALDRFATLTEKIDASERALGGRVFRVPSGNLPDLQKEIERINKRASKLDVAPVALAETEHEFIETSRRRAPADPVERAEAAAEGKIFYETVVIDWVYLIVSGETPRVAGYEFVATLEHDDAGTIIRRVPTFGDDEFDLSAYRNASPEHCDHCGLVRNRKDTYVVRNAETGETQQVGRQCLRDFTGANDPEKFARLAEHLRDFFDLLGSDWDGEEGERGGLRGESHYNTARVLAITQKAIREYGWLSKSKAGHFETSTADWVDRYLCTLTPDGDLMKRLRPEDEDEEKARLVLDWVRSDEFAEKAADDDYLWNLGVACANDYIPLRRLGLVCSAVSAFDREREREIKLAARKQQNATKGFVGTEGKREVFELTLTRVIWIEDRFNPYGGSKPLYIFQDADGNEIKWFASNTAGIAAQVQIDGIPDPQYAFEEIVEGETYRVKATVKRHEDSDKYGKSTLITRAKIETKLSGDPTSPPSAGSPGITGADAKAAAV